MKPSTDSPGRRSPVPEPGPAQLELARGANGLVYLRSPALTDVGTPHAFTTRRGPGDTQLDLRHLDRQHIAAVEAALSEAPRPFHALHQVHGREVLTIEPALVAGNPSRRADALFTRGTEVWLAVRTADCVPILAASTDGASVVAIHAGWRGLVAGVIEAAIGKLAGQDFVAAVGPCLSLERFEVGPEVAEQFEAAGQGHAVHRRGAARAHIDLRGAATRVLERLGARAVDASAHCTWNDAELFHSHRRDVTHGTQQSAGHQAALIAPRAAQRC